MQTPTIRYARKAFARASAFALLVGIGTLLTWLPAHAAPTFVVNYSATDEVAAGDLTNGVCETATAGKCSLRAAIMKANHYPGGGVTIDLTAMPGGIFTLGIPVAGTNDETTGDLNITASMNIIGAGPPNTIIDGNKIDRVFHIAASINVTISSVTVRNGSTADPDGGGGIVNTGTLTLTDSMVSDKFGGIRGGGIANRGALTLTSSTVSGNTSVTTGGGIYNLGTLNLANSTISANVTGNTLNGLGGGIFNYGTLTVTNSTISGNSAYLYGGGIYNDSGTLTVASLFNATITNNQADGDLNGSGTGGGVYNGATLNSYNSIIASNLASGPFFTWWIPTGEDCAGTINSNGYNIVENTQHCTVLGAFTPLDPNIGPLQDNGGPTQTHALLSGSPAIDTGNPGGCADKLAALLTTDQRGATRPFGPRCDIGAYEYGAAIPTFMVAGAANPPAGGSVSCTSPVAAGGTSSCTITTNSGYILTGASSTCGGSLSGTTFTTGPVTSACTVTATFQRFDLTPILELLLLD